MFQEARKNAVALANAKESQQQYEAIHQQVKPLEQQQQLKNGDQQLKSFNQLRQSGEQTDGNLGHQLKSAAEQQEDKVKQLKSAEQQEDRDKQLKPAEQKEDRDNQLKSADELKPVEKQPARNGDVKIRVDAPPDKIEVKEEEVKSEESRIGVEDAADEDEEAMEALLSHDMRETEIR